MDRRQFLQSGLSAFGVCASHSSSVFGLAVDSNFVNATKSVNDYKTLVCVNLQGGADSISLFVPTNNSEYNEYQKIRQNLSYEQSSINPLVSNNENLDGFGLPDFVSSFSSLFNDKKLSIVSNVGPLREPTTLSMIQANKAVLPPFMNSHSDHEALWQTGFVSVNERTGWGGRLIEAFNNDGTLVPNNISLKQTRKFIRGNKLDPFVVNAGQIQNLSQYVDWETNSDLPLRDMFNKLTNRSDTSLDESYTKVVNSAMNSNQALKRGLQTASETAVSYPSTTGNVAVDSEAEGFNAQLKRAAELIEIAPFLGHQRQVIFIQLGMFDTHDNQATIFPALMKLLSAGMKSFQTDLESRGIDDRVVTFTQSEFGRTLTINSNGTDHGWGGHQFVMGTPVLGGQVIGNLPEFAIDSSDTYQSAFIPQFAVEQYGANLARWFGISESEMLDIFPTYNRFDNVDFGLFV